jgi:hypothetical protein
LVVVTVRVNPERLPVGMVVPVVVLATTEQLVRAPPVRDLTVEMVITLAMVAVAVVVVPLPWAVHQVTLTVAMVEMVSLLRLQVLQSFAVAVAVVGVRLTQQ